MKSLLPRIARITRFALCLALIATTSRLASAEELVGSIPGQLSVEQGAAVYTVPIEVPPGVAGMQPDLAITYNSNAGNGLLGVGFSLSGLSVITRCGQTIAQDGQRGGIYYDGRDRFCLDGQRLIAISGTDGGDGTEYRTEIDSYSRIVSHGQQGSGPQWWRVETKSGQVMAFGNTQDSRIEAQGKSTVRLWAVNRIEDTVGNGIDFEYHEDNGNGEYYPTRILYAGGVVEFGYEGRPDSVASYEAGSVVQLNNRMRNISTYAENTFIRSYLARYEVSGLTNRSHLLELNACDQNENCAAASSFSWSATDKKTAFNPAENADIKTWDNPNVRNIPGDFNGDGLTDFLVWHAPFNNYRYNLYLANGNGFDPAVATNLKSWGNSRLDNQVVGDFNGDGMSDMLMWHVPFNNYRFNLYLSNGNGFEEAIATDIKTWDNINVRNISSDFNGDGLTDFLVWHAPFNNHRYNLYLSNGNGFEPAVPTNLKSWDNSKLNNQVAGDFNGDGMSDMLMWHVPFNNYRFNLYLSNGNGFEEAIATDIKTWDNTNIRNISSDFNGDGLTDFLVWHAPFNNHRYNLYLSNGNGFEPAIPTNLKSWDNWRLNNQVVGDFNGDGMSDMLMWHVPFNNHRFNLYLSNGKGFQEAIATDIKTWDNYKVRNSSADFNGDGLTDFLVWHAPFNNYRFNLYTLESSHNLVTGVSNGATQTTLEYEPLTQDQIHGLDTDAVYPSIDLQNPRHVVTEVKTQNGLGGENTVSYRYGGLKANLHGRGSLGFRWIEATDHTRNTITRTEYNQSFPHVGSPERSTTHLIHDGYGGNILLSETETQYDHVTGHSDRVYSPHVVQTTERNYGLDRSLLTTVTTENDLIDGFGNIGRITVTTQGAGETHVKVSTNDYVNDEQRWILGRLTRASVTHIAPDNTQITRASEFAYDAGTGLLTLEAIEPNTALSQTTRYQYDQHGNQIAVTLSAPGLPDRTTETQYDAVGRFPVRVTNALGHSETREYDPACGKPISLTGPNGLTTRWEYDSLCRKTREARADGTETTWAYQWVDDDASDDAPALALYSLTETASGASPVTIFYDALNREVRKDTIGFDGRTIHQETEYNARGEIVRQSLPHFVGETAHWVLNTYDLLGRPDSVSRPAGALTGQSAAVTHYAYAGFATTVTDPMGRQKTTTKNALGQVIRVDEEEGAWLTHTHDAIGNLVETNANGVITRMGYDARGNKIWMQDPDMGRWEYAYNALGELIGQTDAKGQTVAMEYDLLGRMVRREESEGITTWEYDTAGHGIGKLALIRAPNGFYKAFGYDDLGRPSETSTHADSQDFIITTGYDQFGRVAESIRPDGFTVQHTYNAFGYLEALRAPREHILDYDTAHLHTLYQNAREMATLLLDETTDYLQKAAEYREKAGIYQQLADQDALYARALALLGEAQAHMEINAEPGTVFAPINAARELIRPLAETALQAEAFPELATTLEGVAQELATAAAESAEELDGKLAELERWGEELERISGQMARMDHDPYHLYLWQAKGRDAAGRLTGTLFGNGLSTNKIYDPASGELLTIQSGFGTALPIRDLGYTYDLADNVTARSDNVQDIQETFQYDRLDRLTASTVLGTIGGTSYHNTLTYSYDAQGNMTHHSGVGAYLYGAGGSGQPGPHATTRTGDQEIQYDANGSMTQAGDRSIEWTSFHKPKTFQRGASTIAFDYGPDRARYLKTGTTTEGNPQRTVYLGRLYEQETTSGAQGDSSSDTIRRKHFLYADGQLAAIHIKTEQAGVPQPDETRYLHRDNLGSIDTITDGRGNIVERMSYEAFGARRAGNWRSADDPLAGIILPAFTNRGFTGHEHVDEMGLIHMNGRVYDPGLGRFLSADPNIQSPYSSQSYNRYSYVLNNPLKYTDPSGFSWWSKHKKQIIAVAIIVVASYAATSLTSAILKSAARKTALTAGTTTAEVATAGAAAGTATSAAVGSAQAGFWVTAGAGAAGGVAGGAIMGAGFGYMETGSLSGAFDGAIKGAAMGAVTGTALGGAGYYLKPLTAADDVAMAAENTGKLQKAWGTVKQWGQVAADHYKGYKVAYDSLGKIATNMDAMEDAIAGPQDPSGANLSPLSVSASANNRHQAARAWSLTTQTPTHAASTMANRHWSGYGARNRNNARRFQRALRVSYL